MGGRVGGLTSYDFFKSVVRIYFKIGQISGSLVATFLVRGNVEPNPGPRTGSDPFMVTKYIDIITLNCNGLGEKRKLK